MSTASAAPIVFTDEATFVAAVGTHDLETFETAGLGDYGTSMSVGALSFDSSPSSAIIVNDTPVLGSHNTTAGGEQYLEAWSGIYGFHEPMVMGRNDGPLLAWGATFTDFDFNTANFFIDGVLVLSLGPFTVPANNGNELFVGFLAPLGSAFNAVTLEIADRRYGIDNVRSVVAPSITSVARNVPEPGLLALLPFVALAMPLARRRARAA